MIDSRVRTLLKLRFAWAAALDILMTLDVPPADPVLAPFSKSPRKAIVTKYGAMVLVDKTFCQSWNVVFLKDDSPYVTAVVKSASFKEAGP